MQGNLNEIDIRSILQLILGQRTGELFVEAYSGSYKARSKPRIAQFSVFANSLLVGLFSQWSNYLCHR